MDGTFCCFKSKLSDLRLSEHLRLLATQKHEKTEILLYTTSPYHTLPSIISFI